MLIDWFTIVAQILNFLLLLFLLRRFLYRPILNAMDERQRQVRTHMEEAEQKRQEAEAERSHFQAKNQELKEQYEQKQEQAEAEVAAWKKESLRAARQEVERALEDWRHSLDQSKGDLAASLRQFAVQQAYSVARRAGLDLADAELENLMAMTFLRRLEQDKLDISQVNPNKNDDWAGEYLLRSAFELSADTRQQIHSGINKHLEKELPVRFEVMPELAAGIELVSPDGYRAAWNLKRYLEGLEEQLERQLQGHFGAEEPLPERLEQ